MQVNQTQQEEVVLYFYSIFDTFKLYFYLKVTAIQPEDVFLWALK